MPDHIRTGGPWPCLVGLVVVAGCTGVAGSSASPGDDGSGPLVVNVGEGGTSLQRPERPDARGRWVGSFGGLVLCTRHAGTTIALESVRLHSVVKPLWSDVFTRTFDLAEVQGLPAKARDDYLPFYGTLGAPPGFGQPYADGALPGDYSPGVADVDVRRTCTDTTATERALTLGDLPESALQELVVSLGVGPGGAEVDRLDVVYRAEGERHTVRVDWTMVACGDRIRLRDVCP